MYTCVYTSIPEAHEAVGHHRNNNNESNVGPLHHQPHVSEIAEEGDHCVGMDGRQPCERRVRLLLVPKTHCLGFVRVSYSERERGGVRVITGTRVSRTHILFPNTVLLQHAQTMRMDTFTHTHFTITHKPVLSSLVDRLTQRDTTCCHRGLRHGLHEARARHDERRAFTDIRLLALDMARHRARCLPPRSACPFCAVRATLMYTQGGGELLIVCRAYVCVHLYVHVYAHIGCFQSIVLQIA